MVILHGKSSGSCMVFQVEISYLFLLCCCWDTVNWRESISSGNIYYPPCLHSDQAPQLMKVSAASLFLFLSAPFSAHQHFTPAQMHSSQERAFSLFPFTFHSKCVYNRQVPQTLQVILCTLLEILMTSASFKHTLTSNFFYPLLSPGKSGCSTLSQAAQQLLHFTLKRSVLDFLVPGNIEPTSLFPE